MLNVMIPGIHRSRGVATILAVLFLACPILTLQPSQAQARNYFGAIAYSTTSGAYGYSYDYPTRSEAEARAMSECRSRGSGCEVVIWYRNACGALATAANGARGWAWAATRKKAQNSALEYCRNHGGDDCAVLCWSCTTRR